MHLVPQNFDIPKICISGGCKSEDMQTFSHVWHENGYHFCVSAVGLTLKSSKGQPRLSNFFRTLMNLISLFYSKYICIHHLWSHCFINSTLECQPVYSVCTKFLLSLHCHFMLLNHNQYTYMTKLIHI